MGRLQTGLRGVTTTSNYDDGDMYSLVNLRLKGGALQPILPYGDVGSMPARFDDVYVHRNADWEHWIGVFVSRSEPVLTQVAWFEVGGDVVEWIAENLPDKINSVEQSGNLLVFTSDRSQYYALFIDGHYRWYGELPDLPVVEFGCYDEFSEDLDGDDYKTRYVEFKEDILIDEKLSRLKTWETDIKARINTGIKRVDYLYTNNASVNDNTYDFNGLFHDAFFVRYTFRLYDDSYISYSPPVLLMPGSNILDLLTVSLAVEFMGEVLYEKGLLAGAIKNALYDMAFRTRLTGLKVAGFMPGMKYDFSALRQYKDLIKSVDIFISPYVGISNVDNIDIILENLTLKPAELVEWRGRYISSITSEMERRVRDMSSFYLIKSIPVGEDSGGVYIPLLAKDDDETLSAIRNLVHQPQLEESTFIHMEGAKKTFSYNGRLHMADITTTFFNGFTPPFFRVGTNEGWGAYNGVKGGFILAPDQIIITETKIQAGSSIGYVYNVFQNTGTESLQFGMCSAMISYPDIRAKQMTFYLTHPSISNYWHRMKTIELKEHDFLNIAYYLQEGLRPIGISGAGVMMEVPAVDTGVDFIVRAENEMRVSDVNNPLVYNNKNSLVFGSGRVMNMSNVLMNVSNDNYGQYPLYVFTAGGVYTLSVSEGDIPYSSVLQPVYAEAPLSDIVCPTSLGVVFVSRRGLMFINGTRLDYLTGGVEERPEELRLPEVAGSTEVLYDSGMSEMFTEYIKGVTSLTYNSYYNEIIVADDTKPYGWILDLDSGAMCRTTNRAGRQVRNAFPASYNFYDTVVFDINKEAGGADVRMITRPLRYGTPDVKRMERIILRGVFYGLGRTGDYEPLTGLLYSNDSRFFLMSRGLKIKEGNRRDLDLGMFFGQQFRGYVFFFAGRVLEGTKIEFLESEVEKVYNNTKMR
jgi:hypothetical protein